MNRQDGSSRLAHITADEAFSLLAAVCKMSRIDEELYLLIKHHKSCVLLAAHLHPFYLNNSDADEVDYSDY